MANFIKMLSKSVKHWYLPLIAGIIFIAVGVIVFTTPQESYLALSVLFSVSFLITGLSDIIFSISNRKELEGWGWNLALGLLNAIVGIMLFVHPEISVLTLPLFVGFVVLFRSIAAIGTSFELKNYYVLDWGYLMVIGVLGIIFSFILIWNPGFAGLSLVIWTALSFIAIGAYNIYLSMKLKKLKDIPQKISAELKEKYKQIKGDLQTEIIRASKQSSPPND